jgi:dihydrofolate synthase/folylpolyglutamate synthase
MARTKWLGRLQSVSWRNASLLVDGAHNPASAQVLRQYVDTLQPSGVNWVMGMLSTKDHREIFQALLKSGDRLYLVPVPDPLTANPEALSTLAWQICPQLTSCQTYTNLEAGLTAATQSSENLVVLCGSLYLIGYFLKTNPMKKSRENNLINFTF